MIDISSSLFWIAVLQIIAIDIMRGGDNAVVIALACRKLPPEQRKKGIFWGVVGAIGLRVVMIFFALQLLTLPYLKIVGALLLLWIGVKLLLPEQDDGHGSIGGSTTLMAAIKTIIVADAVMSLDNVVAVAGASHGSMVLVTFGILVSIPIVVWGSKLVLTLMDRFPMVITLGAALLGWIAADRPGHASQCGRKRALCQPGVCGHSRPAGGGSGQMAGKPASAARGVRTFI